MKKYILIILIFYGLKSTAQNAIPRFVKLTSAETNAVVQKLNWDDNTILIINFITPLDSSGNSIAEATTVSYWNDFYKNFDSKKFKVKLVYSDCVGREQLKNSKLIHLDNDEVLRTIFFPRDKTCSGIAVLNKKGSFKIKSGTYTQEDIEELVAQLINEQVDSIKK
ncbi:MULTISPECIES: hypothetical protein [unclassified Flavobacterium]|uniref:hypothetical protein n=1 Tax=unclassified Flavobacterium TaxID=196869 RepID=UPI003F910513